jgi:hypothetical protein
MPFGYVGFNLVYRTCEVAMFVAMLVVVFRRQGELILLSSVSEKASEPGKSEITLTNKDEKI